MIREYPAPVGSSSSSCRALLPRANAHFPSGDSVGARPSPRRTAGEPSLLRTYSAPVSPPASPVSSNEISFPSSLKSRGTVQSCQLRSLFLLTRSQTDHAGAQVVSRKQDPAVSENVVESERPCSQVNQPFFAGECHRAQLAT